jgi:hypothetical protein
MEAPLQITESKYSHQGQFAYKSICYFQDSFEELKSDPHVNQYTNFYFKISDNMYFNGILKQSQTIVF